MGAGYFDGMVGETFGTSLEVVWEVCGKDEGAVVRCFQYC